MYIYMCFLIYYILMIAHIKNRLFLSELIIFSAITAALHYLALTFSLYWSIEWYDIMMHFLGGVTMAFLAVFVLFTSEYIKGMAGLRSHILVVFLALVSFTLIVGLIWELWEIFVGFSDILEDRGDTILDLIMDTLGAITVFVYVKEKME